VTAPVRAGLIGLGMMGTNHARVLSGLPEVDLVGIVEPHPGARRVEAPLLDDLDQLLDLGIDACVVAVPTADHEAIGLRLAEAGVHALVEKPLAETHAAAQRVADAFQHAGLVGCVGHIERYNPAIRELRRRLAEGELGEVFQVATRRQGPFPNRIRDVGVVKDLATHDIDITAWVTGSPYRSLSARVAHRSGRAHEDLVAVNAALDDGTVVNHLVNWLTPMKERTVVVTGEGGCLVADTLTADLTRYANAEVASDWSDLAHFRGVSEGDVTRYAISKPEPLLVELTAFRDAVLGRESDLVTMREAARVVEVADACVRSAAADGELVRLGPS